MYPNQILQLLRLLNFWKHIKNFSPAIFLEQIPYCLWRTPQWWLCWSF